MLAIRKNRRRDKVLSFLQLFLCCALLVCEASGQVEKSPPELLHVTLDKPTVERAVEKLAKGDFDLRDVEIVAQAQEHAAIPVMEEQFGKIQDRNKKMKLAVGLDRLGVKDAVYWDYMVRQVTPIVNSPDPRSFDTQGKQIRGQVSPEFADWARKNSLPADPVYQLPGLVMLFGEAGDPRGIPLLRQGLLTRNYFIQAQAAKGLAQAQDKDSIPLIIQACQQSPPEGIPIIAKSLLYFDDPKAEAAFDKYEPPEDAKLFRQMKAAGEKF